MQFPLPDFSEDGEFQDAVFSLHAEHPDWLHTVYRGADDRFVIYQLDPAHEPSESGLRFGIAAN